MYRDPVLSHSPRPLSLPPSPPCPLRVQDWAANFKYPFCANESTAAIGIPGRVHQGFLEYLIAMAPLLDAEVERIKPRRISLAGDSVGGAVSVITGAYLAR
jgi:predicted lipase